MKKLIALLGLFVLHVALFAQSPQGINYQAVAYNNLGQPVTNQTVGIRLSVLDGGAAGPVLYSETQAPNTDNTGLFSIVVGNGTPVSGTFADINWANGTRWLKTEIDIAGGNNYVVMGSSQFMSVPYALYADKTGFRSGSFNIPDGFDKTTTVILSGGTNYTVPVGKNLYITGVSTVYSAPVINGDTLRTFVTPNTNDIAGFLAFGENSILSCVYGSIVGFLTDKTVEWKTINLLTTSFTVPANKQFVILKMFGYPQGPSCIVTLNGTGLGTGTYLSNVILDAGDVLSSTGCTGAAMPYIINGYLINK